MVGGIILKRKSFPDLQSWPLQVDDDLNPLNTTCYKVLVHFPAVLLRQSLQVIASTEDLHRFAASTVS